MKKDFHSYYGNSAPTPQARRARSGGVKSARDVMDYDSPSIPGWDPHGSKSPGLGGDNYGNCGTQGPSGASAREGGSVGLGGERRGMGTNRRG